MVIGIDDFAVEIAIQGGDLWQTVSLSPSDFENVDREAMSDWDAAKELRLSATETFRTRGNGPAKSRVFGATWNGPNPEFRNLRWTGGAKIHQ